MGQSSLCEIAERAGHSVAQDGGAGWLFAYPANRRFSLRMPPIQRL
jgi:hypothetical protein